MMNKNKLNLGCGTDIKDGFINVDSFPLRGVDVAHDLSKFPWPFNNGQFDEVIMRNILEHLPDTIATMEELWRILKLDGRATIAVPYWNSSDAYIDPTHIKYFHQESFDFYDPSKHRCKERPYMSTVRFTIEKTAYYAKIAGRYILIRNPIIKAILTFFAAHLNNIIWTLIFDIRKIENSDKTKKDNKK